MKKAKFVCNACVDTQCVLKTTEQHFVADGTCCPFASAPPASRWIRVC